MATHSKFLKYLRLFAPAVAATILLTSAAAADPPIRSRQRSADGVRIAYEVRGRVRWLSSSCMAGRVIEAFGLVR